MKVIFDAIHWLNPLVYLAGIAIGVWGCRISRKLGYLFVALYFLLVLTAGYILPSINDMIWTDWQKQRESEISPQAHDQFIKEYSALLDKYYPPSHAATLNVDVRLGPFILVAGLWMLAKRESRSPVKQEGHPDDPN